MELTYMLELNLTLGGDSSNEFSSLCPRMLTKTLWIQNFITAAAAHHRRSFSPPRRLPITLEPAHCYRYHYSFYLIYETVISSSSLSYISVGLPTNNYL